MAIGIQDQYFGTEIEMTGITRQRAAEKARRERRKAKKIAENGGEIVRKKVCPYCGK